MFPVVLEQWFPQNENLLKKMQYSEENSIVETGNTVVYVSMEFP